MPSSVHSAASQRVTASSLPIHPSERWTGPIACVCAAVLVLSLSWHKLADVDAGYHVAYGRHLLATGHIVERDPFLYPQNSQPFVNANWGSQLVMALAERAAGVHGLIALRSLLLLIVFASIALIAWTVSNSWHAIAWAWVLAAVASYERFSMRPELFSYALMTIQVALLTRANLSRMTITTLIAIQLVWVNLHSYFLIGILLTLACLAAPGIALLLNRTGPAFIRHRARGRMIATVLIGQLLVTFVNPWHWRGAIFPLSTLRYLQNSEVLAGGDQVATRSAWGEISEFQKPIRFVGVVTAGRTINAWLVMLSLAGVGFVLLLVRGRPGEALIVLLLAVMSYQMRRNIAQFAFIAAPLSFGVICCCLAEWLTTMRPLARVLSLATVGLLSIYWAVNIHSGYFYFVERRINREFGAGYHLATYPQRAVFWLARQDGLKPNLFVDYFSSSNTLLWLPERFKLYVDTNTFAYSEPTLRTAFDVGLGREPHQKFFDDNGVNIVLLHGGPDTQLLIRALNADTAAWALIYVDSYDVIFARRIPEHASIIAGNAPTADNTSMDEWADSASGGAYAQAQTICLMANVPISLGWYRSVIVLMDQVLRRTDQYPQAWYLSASAHVNLAKAAGRANNLAEMKIQCRAALEAAAKAVALDPEDVPASRICDEMKSMLAKLGTM